jgi:MbtH protein
VNAEPDSDATVYRVVVNAEEQYSIWPEDRPSPPGWTYVWGPAAKQECLAHIERTWTDLRPLSLRRRMARRAGTGL